MGEDISVIVITYNAEATIEKCLSSVAGLSDDIVVVDSFSTDSTPDIVRKYTDRFFQQKWQGYSAQKRSALQRTKNQWVLWVDSDEEASEQLVKEIRQLDFSKEGYFINCKAWYLGRWINHGEWYPNYILRLFRKDRCRFSEAGVHEKILIEGETGYLKSHIYHYTYRDIGHHLEKINLYTRIAAGEMALKGRKSNVPKILFHTAGNFLKTYFVKRGFLDGTAGFIVSVLGAFYVFLKYARLWEINRKGTERMEKRELRLR